MTVFEYSIGLISIVVGLAVARALGGIGTFMASSERSAFDWIGVAWCVAILMNLIGWWIVCWKVSSANPGTQDTNTTNAASEGAITAMGTRGENA